MGQGWAAHAEQHPAQVGLRGVGVLVHAHVVVEHLLRMLQRVVVVLALGLIAEDLVPAGERRSSTATSQRAPAGTVAHAFAISTNLASAPSSLFLSGCHSSDNLR